MSDPSIAGIITIACIAIGAAWYASVVIPFSKPKSKKKVHPLQSVADAQSEALKKREPCHFDGMSETDWLHIAARWLLRLWPNFGLERAVRELKDYMPDRFGHPDYDWSESAAKELAEEYARDFGEEYGSNQ